MIAPGSRLVLLVGLVDRIPMPAPDRRRRGRPPRYADRLFLKALVVMIVRHLHRPGELLAVLDEPTPEMQQVRALLTDGGCLPCRRTWERRLARLPETLPGQIASLGHALVQQLHPWADCGRAVAIDSTVLHACGGVWHAKHRARGLVPHTSIDTEANWTKSGWHGWVYGWKLHLVSTVARVWIPLAAELTPANVADNEVAATLLASLPDEVRYVLGDLHYNAPNVRDLCQHDGVMLVASQYGPYPHTDAGVEVRRVFHKLRSANLETFNELFKGIFDVHGSVPTKGLRATRRFALGALFVYQLTLLARSDARLPLRTGLKAFLKAA
jgi:Transposase DDE domain